MDDEIMDKREKLIKDLQFYADELGKFADSLSTREFEPGVPTHLEDEIKNILPRHEVERLAKEIAEWEAGTL